MFVVHISVEDIAGIVIIVVTFLVLGLSVLLIWFNDFKIRTKNRINEWKQRWATRKEKKKWKR